MAQTRSFGSMPRTSATGERHHLLDLINSHSLYRLFATLLWFLGEVIDTIPVYERSFALDDPLISHPHRKQQYEIAMISM